MKEESKEIREKFIDFIHNTKQTDEQFELRLEWERKHPTVDDEYIFSIVTQFVESLQKEQPKEQGAEEFFKKWSNGMPLSFVMENKDLCIDLLTEYAQQLNNVPTDEEIEKEAEKFFKKRSHQEVHGGDLVLSESAFDDYIDKILKNK